MHPCYFRRFLLALSVHGALALAAGAGAFASVVLDLACAEPDLHDAGEADALVLFLQEGTAVRRSQPRGMPVGRHFDVGRLAADDAAPVRSSGPCVLGGHGNGSLALLSAQDLARRIGGGPEQVSAAKTKAPLVLWMLGDSTMREQHKALCEMAGESLQTRDYKPGVVKVCNGMAGLRPFTAVFYGFHEASFTTPELLESFHAAVPARPSAIYFNGGLHLLHLMPARKWDEYEQWRHAEQLFATFLDTASTYGAELVFMTSHAICEDKFRGAWAVEMFELRQDPADASATRTCAEWLTIAKGLSVQAATEECEEGTFTLAGTRALDARLRRTWGDWLAGRGGKQQVKAACVDSFALTEGQCALTEDGRHYAPLVPSEVLTLWQALGADDDRRGLL